MLYSFIKSKLFLSLVLGFLFTIGSVFWTSDLVHNREELTHIELGWLFSFVEQNHYQLDPPFHRNNYIYKARFGLPQEYITDLLWLPFVASVVINSLIILTMLLVLFKLFPPLRPFLLFVKAWHVILIVTLIILLFVAKVAFDSIQTQNRRGVGILPPSEYPSYFHPNSLTP